LQTTGLVPAIATGSGREHYQKSDAAGCAHAFCLACLGGWVAAQVDERQRHIRCPAVDCTARMYVCARPLRGSPLLTADIAG